MRQEQSKGGRMMFIAKWRRCRSLLQTLSGFAPTGYGVDLRSHMTVDEAVSFLRRDARDRAQTIYYAYVTDSEERLLGVVTFRDLLLAPGDKTVQDVMRTDVIT